MTDQQVLGHRHLVVGTETKIWVLQLGRGVDPAALIPAEGTLLIIVGDDVLPELGPDSFENVAESSDDGEVPTNSVRDLDQIDNGQDDEPANDDDNDGNYPHHAMRLDSWGLQLVFL